LKTSAESNDADSGITGHALAEQSAGSINVLPPNASMDQATRLAVANTTSQPSSPRRPCVIDVSRQGDCR
jgi:hypothetical protein